MVIWGVPKIGVPANHPNLDYFCIDTHGFGPPISGNLHILVNHNHDSLTSAAFRDSYPILQPSLGIFSLTSISDAWSPGWRKPWLNSGHMWSPGVGKNHQLANKMEVSWGFHSHGATPIAGWFTKKNIYGWGLGVPPFQDREKTT